MTAKLCSIAVMCAGAVLVHSGLVHAWQPFYYGYHVALYGLVPQMALGPVIVLAPYLYIVVGTALIAGVERRFFLLVASALFTLFVFAQATAMIRDEGISCGCFGFYSTTVSWKTIAVPAICALATVFMSVRAAWCAPQCTQRGV